MDKVRLDVGRYDRITQLLDECHVTLSHERVRVVPIVTRFVWPSEMDLMSHSGIATHERWAAGSASRSKLEASVTSASTVGRSPLGSVPYCRASWSIGPDGVLAHDHYSSGGTTSRHLSGPIAAAQISLSTGWLRGRRCRVLGGRATAFAHCCPGVRVPGSAAALQHLGSSGLIADVRTLQKRPVRVCVSVLCVTDARR